MHLLKLLMRVIGIFYLIIIYCIIIVCVQTSVLRTEEKYLFGQKLSFWLSFIPLLIQSGWGN